MIDLSSCTEKELWEYVAVELSKQGLKNVLVGGAVAAIYSEGIYKSGDLDFVIESYGNTKPKIEAAMKTIGFEKVTRHWIHPNCSHLYVEFCNPPVSVGEDYQIEPIKIQKNGVDIYILSPTDCVKDRLASYIHWNARECFDQAVYVARSEVIDYDSVKSWLENETKDASLIFSNFIKRVNATR